MDNNELNDVIKELILKFKNTIPKENERLIEAFENYLLSILSECKNNNESKEFIIFHLNRIADKFISYNIEQKKRELLEDENLEEIRKMSGEIFNKAKSILKNKEEPLEQDYQEVIDSMQEICRNVEEYNKEEAGRLISESILDSGFITNPENRILSFRLARYKQKLDKNEEER